MDEGGGGLGIAENPGGGATLAANPGGGAIIGTDDDCNIVLICRNFANPYSYIPSIFPSTASRINE